jgi:hypothetical protein
MCICLRCHHLISIIKAVFTSEAMAGVALIHPTPLKIPQARTLATKRHVSKTKTANIPSGFSFSYTWKLTCYEQNRHSCSASRTRCAKTLAKEERHTPRRVLLNAKKVLLFNRQKSKNFAVGVKEVTIVRLQSLSFSGRKIMQL